MPATLVLGLLTSSIGQVCAEKCGASAEQQDFRAIALADYLKAPRGEHCAAMVPDTLDLTQHARLALHGMAGTIDPKANFEWWFRVNYDSNPACMSYDARSFAGSSQKMLESFAMLLAMTGCDDYNKNYNGLKNLLISWIAEDGLMYARVGPDRPWDNVCPEDYANVYGQSRLMLAMMAIYQLDRNPAWLKLIGNTAAALERIAIDKGDYAYYPVNNGNDKVKMGEGYCYPKSGWYNTDEAVSEAEGTEGSMFMYHCGPIRSLSRWYEMTGDKNAIDTARKLVNYVMQKKFWGSESEWPRLVVPNPPFAPVQNYKIVGPDRAHFTGHFHGHTAMLYALIEYANATNDKHLKEFVRAGYEYSRNLGIARLGLFGETCTISDMIAIAVKLSEVGIGDYWDDVDGYIRNQLIEQQLIDADYLRNVSEAGPAYPPDPKDHVIERTVGIFCDAGDLGQIPGTHSIQCCSGNGTQALYYVWESTIRKLAEDHVQVNLLLNRASSWMDIASYLPYEGKVALKNKTARALSIRLPNWANRSKIVCTVDGKPREFIWIGNYAFIRGLKRGNEIVFTLPVEQQTVSYTVLTRQQWAADPREKNPPRPITYSCYFKGNTLVDFSPRPDGRWYPNYLRDQYKNDKAPIKELNRFVPSVTPSW